jgi:glycosyltransferase involved in cell wall biosynthesis
MPKPDLSVIILTFNEDNHIERCIKNVAPVAKDIVVVDSYSTDDTVRMARNFGVRVLQNNFVSYAAQLNWALDNVPIHTDWVMRLDADEYPSEQLSKELLEQLTNIPSDFCGLVIQRQVKFMGKLIRYGGFGSLYALRIWRRGTARCEARWMDEHMVLVRGKTKRMKGKLIDENLNNISWWTQKHLTYAAREAIDLLNLRYGFMTRHSEVKLHVWQASMRRFMKERFYSRLPLGFRPVLFYLYRIIILGGILDGPKGWTFIFLQGLWYRMIVDIKVMEVQKRMARETISVIEAIRDEFGIDPLALGESK